MTYANTDRDRALAAIARDMAVLGENQTAAGNAPAIADALGINSVRTTTKPARDRGADGLLDCIGQCTNYLGSILSRRMRLYGPHAAAIFDCERSRLIEAVAAACELALPVKPDITARIGDLVRCGECGSPYDCEKHDATKRFPTGVDDGFKCPDCGAFETDPKQCEVCECCGGVVDDDPWKHHAGLCGGGA